MLQGYLPLSDQLLPLAVQKKFHAMEQDASQVNSNNFEEEVRVTMTSRVPLKPDLCLQMRSAFWRGATLLKELDLYITVDAGQRQEEPAASAGPSTDTEGFRELPRDVALLESVIGKLMDKVA